MATERKKEKEIFDAWLYKNSSFKVRFPIELDLNDVKMIPGSVPGSLMDKIRDVASRFSWCENDGSFSKLLCYLEELGVSVSDWAIDNPMIVCQEAINNVERVYESVIWDGVRERTAIRLDTLMFRMLEAWKENSYYSQFGKFSSIEKKKYIENVVRDVAMALMGKEISCEEKPPQKTENIINKTKNNYSLGSDLD